MNHLAHALLAAPDDDRMFGSLIADFVRGAIDANLPRGVRAGIVLHRWVDGYTDTHAEVVTARALFEPPYRRYAGILLDVWFDHLLARQWSRFGAGSLHTFSRRVQVLLSERGDDVPERMRGFVGYLLAHDLPERYGDLAMIGKVLHGLSQRLSRTNPLAGALPVLVERAEPLQRCFDVFFPDLQREARREVEHLDRAFGV